MYYGFECMMRGQWDRDAVGYQDRSNLFARREDAEAELPRLAGVLGLDVGEVRVVEISKYEVDQITNTSGT